MELQSDQLLVVLRSQWTGLKPYRERVGDAVALLHGHLVQPVSGLDDLVDVAVALGPVILEEEREDLSLQELEGLAHMRQSRSRVM
jgi:hypothetical protein